MDHPVRNIGPVVLLAFAIAAQSGASAQEIAGASAFTNPTPISDPAVLAPPHAPQGFTAGVLGTQVTFNWTAPTGGGAVSQYMLEAGSGQGLSNLASAALGNQTSVTVNAPAGTYYVRLRATNAAGMSAPSNEVLVRVGGTCSAPPTAPSTFSAQVTGLGVRFGWVGTSSQQPTTTYVLEAGNGPGASNLAVLQTTATSFSAVGPPGLYYARVRARNPCGVSPPSNEVAVQLGCAGPPSAPTGLVVTVNGFGVTLNWSSGAGPAPERYVLEVGLTAGATNFAFDTGNTATTLSVSAPAGTYYVRIRARNACGTSAVSNQAAVVTPGGGADTTAPVRSTSQPNITLPAGTTQTTISLTTNEAATCRYAVTAGVAFANMSGVFSSSGATTHPLAVTGLSNGTVRTHYIKCRDIAGNANSDDFVITVTVSNQPLPPPQNATFYVAPAGNDASPGTLAQPFRTIDRARQAVRGINGSMSTDIQVVLRGGEYSLPSTLVFNQPDSGTNGHDVIYIAYPGERPVLHGGQRVTGWAAVGGGVYKANVGALRFRQLYVNGQRAVRARTPNAGSYYQVRSWDTSGRRVEIASNEIGTWQRLNQVEMVILGKGVNQAQFRLGSVSTAGSSKWVTPAEPERTRLFQQVYPPKEPFRPFYLENALELLDTPGEWYLNADTGEVYYMPRAGENLATADVVVPRLERLVSVAGTLASPVRNIQFRNLTFSYTTWLLPNTEGFIGDQASVVFTQPLPNDEITSYPGHRHPAAVHVEAADNVVFERNVFSHLGSSGLNLYKGTHANRVVGNVFTDLSASGISVGLDLEGNPADSRQVSRDTVIQNNYLSDTGVEFYQTVGIMVAYGDGVVIEHNELSKMPYSGISVGWGWADVDNAARNNRIRYNKIENVLRTMSDGGGIYTLSRQPGTLIAENHVRNIVRTAVHGGFNISGIYLDEGSNFITVRDNVLENTGDRGIFQNANGPNNSISNNGGQSPATIDLAGLEPAYEGIRPPSADMPPGSMLPEAVAASVQAIRLLHLLPGEAGSH